MFAAMRNWLQKPLSGRQISVIVYFALVFFSSTIARLNIEKWAEELGWDRLLVNGMGPMVEILAIPMRFLASDLAIGTAIGACIIAFWVNISWLIVWLSNKWRKFPSAPNVRPPVTPSVSHPFDEKLFRYDPAEEAPDPHAYYELMSFTLEYLMPACNQQIELQKRIIKITAGSEKIAEFAMDGLQVNMSSDTQNFWKYYNTLLDGIDTSEPTIRFEALMDCIKGLESNGYARFCAQAAELAWESKLNLQTNEVLAPAWEAWRRSHNALVAEYEKVKSNMRYKRLFRPLKPARWGDPIPEVKLGVRS